MSTGASRLQNLQNILTCTIEQRPCLEVAVAPNPTKQPCVINVVPEVTSFDETVHINVQGLVKHSKVTLQAWIFSEWRRKEVLFLSYGHFYADQYGHVDLDKNPSLAGTYTGVDSMGLFWSMKPLPGEPQDVRCVVKNVEKLLEVKLAVFPGHILPSRLTVNMDTVAPLSCANVLRAPKAADVKRIEIEEGRVRGTLFLPAGDCQHAGVIDMFGAAGGLMEIRAALLASHGFAVLALAFFRYKDLPRTEAALHMDYFEEAASWLNSHPAVRPGGIGIVGSSSGGSLGLLMAIECPQVRAVVNINGPPFRMANTIFRHGEVYIEGQEPLAEEMVITDEGPLSKTAFRCTNDIIFPVWKSSARILCISGGDDASADEKWAEKLRDLYPSDKRDLVDLVAYPGAGHLLEAPYTPLCRSCVSTMADYSIFWGGKAAPHAVAQKDAWRRTLDFLQTYLPQKN